MMGQWTKCGNPTCVMVAGHPGPCYGTAFAGSAEADWDAHRRQLQARNTELVEENRRLRAQVERQSRIMARPCHACGAAGLPSDAPAAPPVPCPNGYLGCKCQAPMEAPAATEGER